MKTLSSTTMMIQRDSEFEVDIEGWVEYSIDRNYGADADGNRGTSLTTIEEIFDIAAHDTDGEDIELTPTELEQAGELLAAKFLQG